MTRTSTRLWRATSVAAERMCAFARPSSERQPRRSHKVMLLDLIDRPQSASRRTFLKATCAGGFSLAFRIPALATNEPEQAADSPQGKFAPNAFIRIDKIGVTTLVMPQVEMGQGIYTAIAMILAEELDAEYDKVVLEHAPASDKLYANPAFGIQATGGSTSVRAFWTPMRKAGATSRAMLIKAAADRWQVAPETCSAGEGKVVHDASGRKLPYCELVGTASKLLPPSDVPLKDPKNFVLIGKPL